MIKKNDQAFNVCYLSAIFADVAEMLRHGLDSLGHDVQVSAGALLADRCNIVLGAHLLPDPTALPSDSVVFNFEQLGSSSIQINPAYLTCLKQLQVWDYSQKNIRWLRSRGVEAIKVSLGYAPGLDRIRKPAIQDIDVLFYGALNERRSAILRTLQDRGLNVHILSSGQVYQALDEYIARSKVVLNLHYYETRIFEIVRVSLLLCNKKAVVAEIHPETEIEDDLRDAVMGVPYESLVETCVGLVQNESLRLVAEQRGWEIFSKRSAGLLLEPAANAALASATAKKRIASALPAESSLSLSEVLLRRTVPIIINSFNQLTYVRSMVEKLSSEGFRNIYIVDQASDHVELKQWLASVVEQGKAHVLYSPTNKGPHDFFLSRSYLLFGACPFVYTDPDLSWDRLADNFLTRLFQVAHTYKVFKVGSALTLPMPGQLKPGLTMKTRDGGFCGVEEHESQFWQLEVEADIFNAPIDTTLHLFLPQYYKDGQALITGLRLAGSGFCLKHLPWFQDDPMPEDEYRHYLSRSTHTTWRT